MVQDGSGWQHSLHTTRVERGLVHGFRHADGDNGAVQRGGMEVALLLLEDLLFEEVGGGTGRSSAGLSEEGRRALIEITFCAVRHGVTSRPGPRPHLCTYTDRLSTSPRSVLRTISVSIARALRQDNQLTAGGEKEPGAVGSWGSSA